MEQRKSFVSVINKTIKVAIFLYFFSWKKLGHQWLYPRKRIISLPVNTESRPNEWRSWPWHRAQVAATSHWKSLGLPTICDDYWECGTDTNRRSWLVWLKNLLLFRAWILNGKESMTTTLTLHTWFVQMTFGNENRFFEHSNIWVIIQRVSESFTVSRK